MCDVDLLLGDVGRDAPSSSVLFRSTSSITFIHHLIPRPQPPIHPSTHQFSQGVAQTGPRQMRRAPAGTVGHHVGVTGVLQRLGQLL